MNVLMGELPFAVTSIKKS